MTGIVATAETDIEASPEQVWDALVDPAQVKKYMFGTDLVTDWKPGGPIVWKGEFEGKRYEDKGEVLEVQPHRRLKVTHYSPLSGAEDKPENYHTVTYELDGRDGRTRVSLSQDNNGSEDEAKHSKANWEMMLKGLKEHVEGA